MGAWTCACWWVRWHGNVNGSLVRASPARPKLLTSNPARARRDGSRGGAHGVLSLHYFLRRTGRALPAVKSGGDSEREGHESQHVGCSLPPHMSPSDLGNALSVFFCPPPKSTATEAPSEPIAATATCLLQTTPLAATQSRQPRRPCDCLATRPRPIGDTPRQACDSLRPIRDPSATPCDSPATGGDPSATHPRHPATGSRHPRQIYDMYQYND